MGILGNIFSIFKKEPEAREHEEVERLMDYIISLLTNRELMEKQIEKISEIEEMPAEKRKGKYLALYLETENILITSRPVEEQENFSSRILRGGREHTREDIRKSVRKNIKIDELDDKIKLIFLDGFNQKLLLFEVMCQELVRLASAAKVRLKISSDFFKDAKIENNGLDFTIVNEKIKGMDEEKLTSVFARFFLMLYKQIQEKSKDLADEIVGRIYSLVQSYGTPINLTGMKILPIRLEEASVIAAREVLNYMMDLIPRKDLIRPQLEKLKKAEVLPIQEKEKTYFVVYLELEKFITNHEPPAVKEKLDEKTLISRIRGGTNIKNLKPRFKLLFLEEDEQIIELLLVFTERFLIKLAAVLELSDLQNFIAQKTKGTYAEGIEIGRKNINLRTAELKLSKIPKDKLKEVISDFSDFLSVLHKEAGTALGGEEMKSLMKLIYGGMERKYSALPTFSEFLRNTPESIFRQEKRGSLGAKAAEEVVAYLIELLKNEKIGEQREAFEAAKKLSSEKQSNAFFQIYLELIHYIARNVPRIEGKPVTISDVKDSIRKKVHVRDLEDRFQVLFLRYDELLMKLVKDLIKECIANFIDKNALIDAERELIQKEKLLKGVEIDDDGDFKFESLAESIDKLGANKVKAIETVLGKVIIAIFETAKGMLGEIQAKRLFETSYTNLQKKYGANLLEVLKVIPKGILEAKKFELLGKEQLQKTATELTRVETLKGEFMNIAAHELKTPLIPILTYLEMILEDKNLKPEHRKKLEICLTSAKREVDLVSDILDISKVEAGSLKLEFDRVDIAKLLNEAIEGLKPAAEAKKIYLKGDISELPPTKGDWRRLTQVVTNFINNATKFTDKGGITVKAEVKGKDILVSVSDTGIGISQKNVKKLFTKFFQADTSARRKHPGTGLGLAISKGIIEGHKGKIGVKSELEKGSTFYFTIPIVDVPKTSAGAAEEKGEKASKGEVEEEKKPETKEGKAEEKLETGGKEVKEEVKAEKAEEVAEKTEEVKAEVKEPVKEKRAGEEMKKKISEKEEKPKIEEEKSEEKKEEVKEETREEKAEEKPREEVKEKEIPEKEKVNEKTEKPKTEEKKVKEEVREPKKEIIKERDIKETVRVEKPKIEKKQVKEKIKEPVKEAKEAKSVKKEKPEEEKEKSKKIKEKTEKE